MALLEVLIYLLDKQEGLQQFIYSLTRLAEAYQVCKLTKAQVNLLQEKIGSLEIEEKEIRDKQRNCRRYLSSAEIKAQSFMDIVERLFDYADLGEDRIISMKESFRNGDTSRIANFTAQIKKYLNRCQEAYLDFREKYDEAIELCDSVSSSEKSRVKSTQSKALKIASVTTGLVVASGIAIALSGSVTLGTGSIAGGTLAVGGTVFAATILLAKKFYKLQRSFQEIHGDLIKTRDRLDGISSQMDSMKELLESTYVDHHLTRDFDDFCAVFDTLLKEIRHAHPCK